MQNPANSAKPTLADIVSAIVDKPVGKKKSPPKKALSPSQLASVACPFVAPSGPSGFKYVYICRSRKITSAETRSRIKKCGIDISRVLDISFPAHGIIGVLVHCQYASTFVTTMKRVNADLYEDFDPLDPKHIADPQ